jgi:hypothetical protein
LFSPQRIRKVAARQGGGDQATSVGSGAMFSFFVRWRKRRTRRDGDTLRHSFAIKRGIAIMGFNVNSRESQKSIQEDTLKSQSESM